MLNLENYLLKSARIGLHLQSLKKTMPAGQNGPWDNIQTPVRNTGHWAIIFLKAYQLTNNNNFKNAAIKCYEFLLSKEARPLGYAYYCIDQDGSMAGNGLIGQAWVLESLLVGYDVLDDNKLLEEANDLFKKHMFCKDTGLYHVLSVKGKIEKIHSTFNQQLFFAAMGAKLNRLLNQNNNSKIFLDKFWDIININKKIPILQKIKFRQNMSFRKKCII